MEFYAPLHLPDGVTITRITFYWMDLSTPANAQLILNSSTFINDHTQEAVLWSTGDDYVATSSILVTSIEIPDDEYAYLTLVLPINIEVYGILLEYTYPAYLGIIKK